MQETASTLTKEAVARYQIAPLSYEVPVDPTALGNGHDPLW